MVVGRTWSLAFFDQSSPTTPTGYAVEVFDDNTARPDAFTRDDMKFSEKSYQQQFTRPTHQLADDKSRLPASTYGAGTPMVVEEDCIVTCDEEGARTHADTQWKKGISPIVRS